ncbi:hypothetical protein [Micromonospora sp. NPDC001898]|uniref:hypothetical protein n=1 Tax=Micromonospora sp. NPDC001898 TaxID=3364221 RepID=UPI0036797113
MPRSYDAGKRINGRRRFIVTDTLGLAGFRLGPGRVLAGPRRHKGALLATYTATPIRHVFADSGFGQPTRRVGPRPAAHHRRDRP